MKKTHRLPLFAALLCAFVLSLVTVAPAHAAAQVVPSAAFMPTPDITSPLSVDVSSLLTAHRSPVLFAQTEAPAPSPSAEAADSASNLGTLIAIALALVSGLAAIWQNQKATQSQKIAQSIILGVEQATRLPQVQEFEKKVKGTIAQKTRDLGIEKEVDALVQRVTRY